MFFLGTLPFVARADPTVSTCPSGQICNPFNGGDTLNQLIVAVLNNVIMPIAAVVSVCYIVWAGFKYVRAQGNEKAIQEAHQNLLYALIGVGILLGAAGISQVIQSTITALIKP